MSSQSEAHTPALVLEQLQDRLKVFKDKEQQKRPFLLRGVYQRSQGKLYNGYFYDRIADEFGEAKITVQVPAALRPTLKDGYIYTVPVFLSPRIRDSYGYIEARVRMCGEVLGEEAPRMSVEELERSQLLATVDRRVHKVDQAWQKELNEHGTLSLAVVTSSSGVAQHDFTHELGAYTDRIHITTTEVNLSKVDEVVRAVEGAEEEVVALVRGGGGGLEASFDDLRLARALTELKEQKLLVSALGHKADTLLVKQIADTVFITPSSLGSHLRNLVEEVTSRYSAQRELERERAERHKLEQERERLFKERSTLESENARIELERQSARQRLTTSRIIVALLTLLILAGLAGGYWMFQGG